ncbi:hypothetical protein BKA67DRAFT_532110 [Truncatella angustata]|uniref:NAD(P)-binding domain-containing protein n=1 Tax=Truncatella angustata TaxID=152316 RepID=A0A9P8ZZ61_9PEZI|nr:uncharacterized protein BKA67DRAFT_532110 [Truncatella angustata]KAH6656867.1 hypothetical protein BKA67DRAFT_532110 [Truncatella angustata]KAH8197820.1 hypothetical protein TruAng_008018 [Truncatella angustata]
MKLIITGATGFVGSEVVRQALRSNQISSVIAVARKPVESGAGIDTSKLKSVIIKDYADYPEEVKKEFAGADACIWTVAITPTKSKTYPWDEVKRVCQHSTIAGMRAIHEAGPNKPFRFLYVSGVTAERDQTKKPGWLPEYTLMRGETETQVLTFAAEHGYEAAAAKPGLISSNQTVARSILGTFMRVTGAFPNVKVEEIAAAMLQQAVNGFEKEPLENADLVRIGQAALKDQESRAN